ncbi:MAG: metallophosphoesterase, partial [Trueperaceae bacterium]
GDVSWALKLEGALPDLHDLDALPGRKVLLRGNHDYWWPSLAKLRRALPTSLFALQHDAIRIGGLVVAGSRGWICPGTHLFDANDERLYRREVERLSLSLAAAERLRRAGDRAVVMMHYPPTNARLEPSGFSERIERFGPDALVYGHVHGGEAPPIYPLDGVRSVFVAADALRFEPAVVLEDAPDGSSIEVASNAS